MIITKNRILHLDGFRAIAALLVLSYHAVPGTKYNWLLGHLAVMGVAMFFVLSGYLISRRYIISFLKAEPMPDFKQYILRRALRILPLFYVVLVVILTVMPFIRPYGFSVLQFSWQDILKHALFLQIYAPRTLIDTFLGNGWTLSIELLFYLLVPILFWFLNIRTISKEKRLPVLLFLIAVIGITSLIIRLQVPYDIEIHAWWQIFGYFSMFCIGMLVVIASEILLTQLDPRRLLLLGLGLTLGLAVIFFGRLFDPFNAELDGIAFAMILLSSLLRPESVITQWLSLKPVVFLGAISYGLYIWQQSMLSYALYFHAFHLRVPMAFVLVIGVSAATYYLVERPCMDLAARINSRRQHKNIQLVEADAL